MITLPSNEQVFGNQELEVIKKMGKKCAVTDFAICLGAEVSITHARDGSLKGRTGWWYLTSLGYNGFGHQVVGATSVDGDHIGDNPNRRCSGIRPVLPYSGIPDVLKNTKRNNRGVLEVEYGEYPQYAPDLDMQKRLESEFSKGTLRKTGKTYTTDSNGWQASSEKFSPAIHEEYEYNGKRYVRINSSNCYNEWHRLSNGEVVGPKDVVWIEVSPIVWYVDGKEELLISKNLLASGVRFCNNRQYDGVFENTEMYEFLNKYFAKDIVPSVNYELDEIQEESQDINLSELDCTIVGKDRFLRGFDDRTEYTLGLLRIVQKALGVPEVPVSSPSETADNGTGVKDLPVYEEPLYTLRQKLMDEGQALDKEIGDSLCEIHLISDEITDKIHGIR